MQSPPEDKQLNETCYEVAHVKYKNQLWTDSEFWYLRIVNYSGSSQKPQIIKKPSWKAWKCNMKSCLLFSCVCSEWAAERAHPDPVPGLAGPRRSWWLHWFPGLCGSGTDQTGRTGPSDGGPLQVYSCSLCDLEWQSVDFRLWSILKTSAICFSG